MTNPTIMITLGTIFHFYDVFGRQRRQLFGWTGGQSCAKRRRTSQSPGRRRAWVGRQIDALDVIPKRVSDHRQPAASSFGDRARNGGSGASTGRPYRSAPEKGSVRASAQMTIRLGGSGVAAAVPAALDGIKPDAPAPPAAATGADRPRRCREQSRPRHKTQGAPYVSSSYGAHMATPRRPTLADHVTDRVDNSQDKNNPEQPGQPGRPRDGDIAVGWIGVPHDDEIRTVRQYRRIQNQRFAFRGLRPFCSGSTGALLVCHS